MTTKYYDILGVSKKSSEKEIKKAYRKLAMKHHPDRGGNEEQFKKISEAYAVLSDPQKKQSYDQYGDASFHQQYSQEDIFKNANFEDMFKGMGFDFGGGNNEGNPFGGSIFDMFMGGGRRGRRMERGADLETIIEIDLESVIQGGEKELLYNHYVQCDKCHGEGGKGVTKCSQCHGSGTVKSVRRMGGMQFVTQGTCPTCHGQGKTVKEICDKCNGKGMVKKKDKIKVKIPKGIFTGATLKLKGEGNYGKDICGDLFIHIKVKPHKTYQREGDDLWINYPITYGQATLGSKVKIPLMIEGEQGLHIPAGTQTHEIFIIKNEGVPKIRGHNRGDLKVKVIVKIPKKLTKKQKELIRELEGIEDKGFLKNLFS